MFPWTLDLTWTNACGRGELPLVSPLYHYNMAINLHVHANYLSALIWTPWAKICELLRWFGIADTMVVPRHTVKWIDLSQQIGCCFQSHELFSVKIWGQPLTGVSTSLESRQHTLGWVWGLDGTAVKRLSKYLCWDAAILYWREGASFG